MGFFIESVYAQGQEQAGGNILGIVMMLIFIVIFYFLLIRPQAKRAKEHRNMVSSLQKGDEVVTGGGVLGKIVELGDNYLLLEVTEGVQIRVQRSSVGALVPKGTIKADL